MIGDDFMATKKLPPNIRQKKNGIYEARKRVNGVDICLSNKDLDTLIEQFEEAKRRAGYDGSSLTGDITLDDWFEKWFTTYKVPYIKESSVVPMKGKYNRTLGMKIGHLPIKNIRNIHIQNALAELKAEGRASSSLRDALGRVRDCLESAKNNQLIPVNPCFDIVVPWENKKKDRRFLSVDEQNKFLETAKFDREWYYPMFMIMFQTGMRIGEVGGLKWSDVDFQKKKIYIQRSLCCQYESGVKTLKLTSTKTVNSVREIPFLGNVESMLYKQKEMQKQVKKNLGNRWRSDYDDIEDLVFTTSMGSPVTRYVAEKEVNKVVDAYNMQENFQAVKESRVPVPMAAVHPHAIRRTFCTRCFEADMNPKVVQKLMGHATYSTTIDIYTDVMKDKMDYETEKFTLGYVD